jgi:hypothetical protein
VLICVLTEEADSYLMDDEDDSRFDGSGTVNKSRIAMCVFVFALLAINPLGVLFGGQPRSGSINEGLVVQGNGRTILSSVDHGKNRLGTLFHYHKSRVSFHH